MSLNTLQQKEVTEVLKNWGLDEKEQNVYFALLPNSPATITPLGKMLNLAPTTVQSILLRLHKAGIVRVEKRKSRHIFSAEKPIVLKTIMEEKAKEVGRVMPFLEKMIQKTAEGKVKIFYRERVTDILHDALSSKSKLVYEIVAAKQFQDLIGEKFHFSKRRIENGIKLKSLRVESREIKKYSRETHMRELREAKFLPRDITFESSIMFWDNKVAIFSTKGEGVALLIESKTIRECIAQIFELLWSVSRTMVTA